MKQFATLRLVQPSPFQPHLHRVQFHFGDDSLQPQDETIVRILWIEHSVLVGDQCMEDRTNFKQVVPILGVPCQAAHLQPEHDADFVIGDELQKSSKAWTFGTAATADAEVVIDHDDTLVRPAKGDQAILQPVLPCGRLLMVPKLCAGRLTHVERRGKLQVFFGDLVRDES